MLRVCMLSYKCTRISESTREAFEWHETRPSASLAPRILSQFRKCIYSFIDAQPKHRQFLLKRCRFSKWKEMFFGSRCSSMGCFLSSFPQQNSVSPISLLDRLFQLPCFPFWSLLETSSLVPTGFPDVFVYMRYRCSSSCISSYRDTITPCKNSK